MQIDQILWKMMEFHDFARILGKSVCQSHPPAKFCAGPAREAPVPESFRVYAKCFPGATHGIVLRTRLGLIPPSLDESDFPVPSSAVGERAQHEFAASLFAVGAACHQHFFSSPRNFFKA